MLDATDAAHPRVRLAASAGFSDELCPGTAFEEQPGSGCCSAARAPSSDAQLSRRGEH
jgi:hypothetical protein